MENEERKPFWAKCKPCGAIWEAAYLPMNLTDFGKLAQHLHCPKCGADARKITPAKQTDGVLEEPRP